jgi:hypothetical protein
MSTLQNRIEAITEIFVEEITGLLREAAKEHLLAALGMTGWAPQLPMPRRQPKHIGPAKTRKPKDLPPVLAKALRRVKRSKQPVTTKTMAKTLGTTESNARQVLGKLLNERLVTAQRLGDGTRRKIYLPG